MKKLVIIILSVLVALSSYAQLENPGIRRGNRFYKKHKYPQAETQYRMALKKNPNSFIAKNNLGLALYREHNDTTALAVLMPLMNQKSDIPYMAQAAYNLGGVYTNLAGDSLKVHKDQAAIRYLEQAKKVLRQSVKLSPDDYQARYNLWVVQKVLDSLKQQSRNQNNQQNQQQQKQNQNNQQNQNQKQQQKQNQNNQQNQQKQNQNQNRQNQQPRPQQGMSPQEIERMLRAVEQQDRKVQQKALRRLMNIRRHKKTDKNW